MEPVYTQQGVKYYVDFAHSPDALEKTLEFASKNKGNGKLIAVCGAPGNRDKEKRPLMGDIALKYADIAILSDDDPDTENRLKILNDMSRNLQSVFLPENKELFIIPERYYAIKLCTEIAKPGDVVVFAGKGHELIQLTNFGKRERNDKKILMTFLQSQNTPILNTHEVKRAYLEELRSKKNPNHVTPQQYMQDTPLDRSFAHTAPQPQTSPPAPDKPS